ncbi:MAG: heme biosynthesis HemY N-terminal domain-containing protein, partial [Pseudomonadota bacterium]
MLWSLTKVLIFVAMVAALAFGAGQLMETSGGITVAVAGVEVTLTVLQATLALLVLILAVWVFLKVFSLLIALLKFINGDETAFSRYFDRSRERRGIDALSAGLVALASGDGKTAMAKAKKADKLLNKPDVTNLVMAQAAEQSGDKRMAEQTYKALLNHDSTRFVGVRGLLQQKLAAGDTDTALKLAEKAFALQPTHEDTQDTLLTLQTTDEDWSGARKTLAAKLRHGSLPRDVHRRRDGIMALSEARKLREAGKIEESHSLALEANRLSPDLVPGVVLAAKAHMEQGKPKLAERVIKAAWATVPHPDLAAAFAAIVPDESAADRVKRFQKLVKTNSSSPESKMVLAESHMANEDYAAARTALGKLVD